MRASYTAEERRRLEAALAVGESARCPACGGTLDLRAVRPPEAVAYVRRRVWVLCPSCGRSGAVDVREAGRP